MEGLQEIGVIWRGELARAVRSGRVVVLLLLFLFFTGISLTGIGWTAWQWNHHSEQSFDEEIANSPYKDSLDPGKIAEQRKKATSHDSEKKFFTNLLFSGEDAALAETLLALPFILLIVFKLTVFFLPFFIALMGFDQISSDLGTKSIRYLVVRVRRSSLLFGKMLTQTSVLGILTFACVLAMVVVSYIVDPEFGLGRAAGSFAKLWVAAMVLSLAYLALTSLTSVLFKQGPLSLVVNIIALFGMLVVAFLGEAYRLPGEAASAFSLKSNVPESVIGYFRYVTPWHYGSELLHPSYAHYLPAVGAYLGFAMVFMGMAYLVLRARDV